MANPVGQNYPQQGAKEGQEQTPRRLRQVLNGVRTGLGRHDGRSPTLSEELRGGQQEMLGIGRELADIARDLQVIIQHEAQLARAEVGHQLRLSSRALVWGGIALVFVFLKLGLLSLAGMFALALVLPFWVSALIMAGSLFILEIGAGFIAYRLFRRVRLTPQRAIESVKEDVTWISSQLKSNRR
jgi:hypothetical protein